MRSMKEGRTKVMAAPGGAAPCPGGDTAGLLVLDCARDAEGAVGMGGRAALPPKLAAGPSTLLAGASAPDAPARHDLGFQDMDPPDEDGVCTRARSQCSFAPDTAHVTLFMPYLPRVMR